MEDNLQWVPLKSLSLMASNFVTLISHQVGKTDWWGLIRPTTLGFRLGNYNWQHEPYCLIVGKYFEVLVCYITQYSLHRIFKFNKQKHSLKLPRHHFNIMYSVLIIRMNWVGISETVKVTLAVKRWKKMGGGSTKSSI